LQWVALTWAPHNCPASEMVRLRRSSYRTLRAKGGPSQPPQLNSASASKMCRGQAACDKGLIQTAWQARRLMSI